MRQRPIIARTLDEALEIARLPEAPPPQMRLVPVAVPKKAGKKSRRLRKNRWASL